MTDTLAPPSPTDRTAPAEALDDPSRQVDWRRLRGPVTVAALVAAAVAAVSATLGTVVAGRLTANPSGHLIVLLALCVIGAAIIDTSGKVAWVGVSDRVEGKLREDVLRAAMR